MSTEENVNSENRNIGNSCDVSSCNNENKLVFSNDDDIIQACDMAVNNLNNISQGILECVKENSNISLENQFLESSVILESSQENLDIGSVLSNTEGDSNQNDPIDIQVLNDFPTGFIIISSNAEGEFYFIYFLR